MFKRATLPNVVWTMLASLLPPSAILAASLVARYGEWVYREPAGRLAIYSFFVVGAVLLAAAGGTALWLILAVFDRLHRAVGTRWLVVALFLVSSFWLRAMLRNEPLRVYLTMGYLFSIALGFFIAVSAARSSRAWCCIDVLAIVAVSLLVLTVGCWLNFVYIRKSNAPASSYLNAATLLAAYILAAASVRLANRPAGRAGFEERQPGAYRVVLAAVVTVAVLAIVPIYRAAYSAGQSEGGQSRAVHSSGNTNPRQRQAAAPGRHSLNIILISIDTLRADHLGLYGYQYNTSPHLDRFFSDAAVFTRMYAQSPWTLPSHMSMITGQYPSTHGARVYPTATPGYIDRLPADAETIAEILHDEGYATAGFTGGGYVGHHYGFDQGFEVFGEAESERMREVLDLALPWLQRTKHRRFFLFLHSYDPHRYNPGRLFEELSDGGYKGPLRKIRDEKPAEMEWYAVGDGFYSLTNADIAFLKYLYDSEIRGVDEQLQRLFDLLRQLDLVDETAVILTADHGENFYEHGATGHAFNMYGPVLHVPLVVSAPGRRRGRHIQTPAQTIDIAPTVLDLAGLYPLRASAMQGISLLPALDGEQVGTRPIISEADALDTQAALIIGGYKYVRSDILSHNLLNPRFLLLSLRGFLSPYAGGERLYDLVEDPGEQRNLAASNPKRTRSLSELLLANLRALRTAGDGEVEASLTPITPGLTNKLRSLGYLE